MNLFSFVGYLIITISYIQLVLFICLIIKVPPTIIDSKTSPDIVVEEGSSVNMTCEALGSPEPRIMWKREDNKMIRYDVGEGENQGIIV